MRLRALLSLLTVGAVLFGMLVPLASPASATSAQVLVRVRVCVVAGTVDVSPGVGRIPPGANNDGGYTFNQVALVCAGVHINATGTIAAPEMVGLGAATSSGGFGVNNCGGVDVPLVGSFCGVYNAQGFLVGPGCAGTVGGDEAANLNPANVAASDWSVTFGVSVNGGITCNTLAEPLGNVANAEIGVIALVAAPVPTSMDCEIPLPNPGDPVPPVFPDPCPGECPAPPPLPQDTTGFLVWFCQIIVVGITVMVAVDVDVVP
jgi:hypothetical protein